MILADHCAFSSTIRSLQAAGYSVRRLKELVNTDARDPEVLNLARQHDLLFLTNDRRFWQHSALAVVDSRKERIRAR